MWLRVFLYTVTSKKKKILSDFQYRDKLWAILYLATLCAYWLRVLLYTALTYKKKKKKKNFVLSEWITSVFYSYTRRSVYFAVTFCNCKTLLGAFLMRLTYYDLACTQAIISMIYSARSGSGFQMWFVLIFVSGFRVGLVSTRFLVKKKKIFTSILSRAVLPRLIVCNTIPSYVIWLRIILYTVT